MEYHLQTISIAEEETRMNRETRVLFENAKILLKENLLTLNEKLQLTTTLIKERKE